jgi:hypothetical protein
MRTERRKQMTLSMEVRQDRMAGQVGAARTELQISDFRFQKGVNRSLALMDANSFYRRKLRERRIADLRFQI